MKDKIKEICNKLNREQLSVHGATEELLILFGVSNCTDLEYSLYTQVVNLKEQKKKLEFMIENGLGWKDMENDITMPHEM